MPFEVRIGATKWDRGENIDAYNRLSLVGREFGFSGWLRESTLISLIEYYGAEKTEWGLRRLHGKGNYSLDTLVGIIEGSIPATRPAPAQYSKPAPQADRSSSRGGVKSVADLIGDRPPVVSYPTKDHVYNEPAAGDWMRGKGYNVKDYLDYFEIIQRTPIFLFQLKSEYR